MNWIKRFLADFPTTNGRIVFTLVVVGGTAIRYLGFGVPYRTTQTGLPVVDGWGYWLLFLGGMAGLDVGQYIGKRFSDTEYAAAKNAATTPTVTVEAPSQVTIATPPSIPIPPIPTPPGPMNSGERGTG